ncbi:MAG: glutamate 5-kinase [Vampirovibrionales bacterium]|jgi:glutamate 5-kinase|nr:glutamate 5-kinase [Vampirovibrionales bacterium]
MPHDATDSHAIEHALNKADSIIVKLGSQVIVDDAGRLAIDRIASYVSQIADLHLKGKRLAIVSSGAVALGRQRLNIKAETPLTPEQKQSCAAIGQSLMMTMYHQFFRHYNIEVAQVLVNPSDFSDRQRYNRLKTLLHSLLDLGIMPIINENDAIPDLQCFDEQWASSRLSPFSDNDKLAALISAQVNAHVLLILSNVDGLYTTNPFENASAERLTYISDLSLLEGIDTSGKTSLGRGGMASKLQAAELANFGGSHVVIASGLTHQSIQRLLNFKGDNGDFSATFIASKATQDTRYKQWIGLASGYNGVIVINEGAANALLKKGASLLAVGVVDVLGQFYAGDVVAVHMEGALDEVARGIVQYSASELALIKGLQSDEIKDVLKRPDVEVIHRDKLVVEVI